MEKITIAHKELLKELHESDENVWMFENANLIREGRMNEVDWENIAEELEIMGKSQFREVYSRLVDLLMHLLKWMNQKERRSSSWEVSIKKQRNELNHIFNDSKNLKNKGEEYFVEAYQEARDLASSETSLPIDQFPTLPQFTINQATDKNYWPD